MLEQLRQLRHLQREIEILQEQIRKAETRVVSDTVTGSGVAFPHIEHTITITGLDQRAAKLRRKLDHRCQELIDAKDGALEYIAAVQDSEIRQILILRYIQGLTWLQVARRMGRAGDGDAERKKHDRYLDRTSP